MKPVQGLLLAVTALCSLSAQARLPDPLPEELAKKQAAADKKARDEEAAKQALQKAQDRVASRYKASRGAGITGR